MEQEKCSHHGKLKMLVALFLVLGAIGLGALAILRDKIMQNNDYQFSVTAEGKVAAKPDIATISFGAQTGTKKTVAEAVGEGNDRMNKIIDELVKLNIDKKDILTTQYSLNPVYSYVPDTGKQNLDGYLLLQSVTVKVRKIESIGDVVQKVTAAGANQTGNIVFTIDDQESLKAEARAQGIKKAQEKAAAIAQESGLKLGKLINVMEGGFIDPVYTNNFAYANEMKVAPQAAIPDIQSGQMEIKVNVTMSYKIK